MTKVTLDHCHSRLILTVEAPEEGGLCPRARRLLRLQFRVVAAALRRAGNRLLRLSFHQDGEGLVADLEPLPGAEAEMASLMDTLMDGFSCLAEDYPDDIQVEN